MSSQVVTFRAIPPLDTHLSARRRNAALALGTVAQEALGRYFALLDAELASVTLTRGEALVLCGLLNGTYVDSAIWPRQANNLLAQELEDSAGDGQAERYEVDLAALVEKVQHWSRTQALSVVDAVERFWSGDTSDDVDLALVRVGLVREKVGR